ncbi:MAG: urease accessory protein UreD [Myxococcota bacterium]
MLATLERSQASGWLGRLELTLGPRAGRTRVLDQRHQGPLTLQRAFHPELDGTAHVVLLHPPGGIVGGDRLQLEMAVRPAARALVTTPGATKVYRSNGLATYSDATLGVADRAFLEYVPQETVVFDGAQARLTTEIHLHQDARALAWEVVCFGRPAAKSRFERGRLALRFDVRRDGTLIFSERGIVDGSGAFAAGRWGLGGASALGTLVATDGDLTAVRTALANHGAATRIGELLVVRALGRDGLEVRRILERARHCVRAAWERPLTDPAIWRT